MRASEALLLGSTILKPRPRTFDDGVSSGCALGMINRAVGGGMVNLVYREMFPWIDRDKRMRPCECGGPLSLCSTIVIHLFDAHYSVLPPTPFSLKERWTIEMIADWLASVDPTPVAAPVEETQSEPVAV